MLHNDPVFFPSLFPRLLLHFPPGLYQIDVVRGQLGDGFRRGLLNDGLRLRGDLGDLIGLGDGDADRLGWARSFLAV